MRHTMGWRIDGLSDQQRDRLITAHDMNDGLGWWTRTMNYLTGHVLDECGCLEGTIAGGGCVLVPASVQDANNAALRGMDILDVLWHLAPPSIRYPQAVARFGKERVIRAIKARAAKPYRVPQESRPVMETVDG